ncbi:caspase domain-containing protein [Mycena vitilis]|nr:caspase domain-containing protein [Mycena vitilis]
MKGTPSNGVLNGKSLQSDHMNVETTSNGVSNAESPQPSPPNVEASPSNGKGTVFALIIGIDQYQDHYTFPHLRGAVNDARAFKKYLLDSPDDRGLHVPPDNICCLENGEATREGILSAFKSRLLNNEKIPDHGEATMILFFAGHGNRSEAPMNLMARDRKVEVICPVDEGTIDGKDVYAIPDYVLGWLLSHLAAKKGSNITVIVDSCHSGGLGRDVGRARAGVKPSRGIPPTLDLDLLPGKLDALACRLRNEAAGFVLLAACSARETAREVEDKGTSRGRFTANLLSLLRWANIKKTTYADLISKLPVWDGQTPHCGGNRTNRLIFDGNYPATGRSSFPLIPTDPKESKPNSSHMFSVPIGCLVGVIAGTEFAAYSANNEFLCTFVAQSVKVAEAIVTGKIDPGELYPVNIPRWSRVRVSDWQNIDMILHVHTPEGFPYTADLFPAARIDSPPCFIQEPLETADVVVRAEDDKIVIVPRTETLRKCQTISRFTLADPKQLPLVFDGVAHFNYFLDRHNKEDPLVGVTLELHRLRGKMPVREPDKSFGVDGNLVEDGAVQFMQEDGAVYGFTIRNKSPVDLFPYLFYFDPEDYTIQNWYKPEGRHTMAPLEAAEGRVTVGMGGETAFEFELPPGQHSSSGYLKLFVTRDFVDFDWVEQTLSPFSPKFEGVGRLGMKKEKLKTMSTWDALAVTLTMARSGAAQTSSIPTIV